jgi:uracil-DNA glycosylase family 4
LKLSECNRCPHLVETRKQVVIARGNDMSGIMMVGEAPGRDENAVGKPFVGRAGQELFKWIKEYLSELSGSSHVPEDWIYITNVVKCWPCNEARNGNRQPTSDEIEACSPWLDLEISRVDPWLIVALGSVAASRLTGNSTLGARVGTLEWSKQYARPVLITYHPAYLVRGAMAGVEAWQRDFAWLRGAVTASLVDWNLILKECKEDGFVKIGTEENG